MRHVAPRGWYLRLLWLACVALPGDVRGDQFSEWRDEIECSRESGSSAWRCALSILLRSLPRLAWRAYRRPSLRGRLPRSLRESWAFTAGKSAWIKALAIAALVVFLDLAAKVWVAGSVQLFEKQELLPHLTAIQVRNPGLSLSFIDGGLYVPAVSAIAAATVAMLSFTSGPGRPWLWLVIGLLVGGALGNLGEWIHHGYVTGFLQFGGWPFVFNVADLAVFVALLLSMAFDFRRSRAGADRQYKRRLVSES